MNQSEHFFLTRVEIGNVQTYVLDVHPLNPRIAMSAGYDGRVIIWDVSLLVTSKPISYSFRNFTTSFNV